MVTVTGWGVVPRYVLFNFLAYVFSDVFSRCRSFQRRRQTPGETETWRHLQDLASMMSGCSFMNAFVYICIMYTIYSM